MTTNKGFLNGKNGTATCPECGRTFKQWNARAKAAFHYVEEHLYQLRQTKRSSIVMEVLSVVGRIELRMTQRALLEYAYSRSFFVLLQKEDSVSAHSLERLGFLSRCSPPEAKMRDRFWTITTQGRLVYEAYCAREADLKNRERQARKRLPRK